MHSKARGCTSVRAPRSTPSVRTELQPPEVTYIALSVRIFEETTDKSAHVKVALLLYNGLSLGHAS